jgi:hypothetical protein
MRVSAVFEGLWLVKKAGGKLIRNSFEIPHDTIPSNVTRNISVFDRVCGSPEFSGIKT